MLGVGRWPQRGAERPSRKLRSVYIYLYIVRYRAPCMATRHDELRYHFLVMVQLYSYIVPYTMYNIPGTSRAIARRHTPAPTAPPPPDVVGGGAGA